MARVTQLLTAFIFLGGIVWGQVEVPGACPEHRVVQNFNLALYFGVWYEIENTFTSFEVYGICVKAEYSDFGNGTVRVLNSQINSQTGASSSIEGSARIEDPPKNEAKLLVNFPRTGSSEGPYWVLDTDYRNYSIVWSCRPTQDNLNSLQTVWFLSRTRNPTEYTRGFVHGYLDAIQFDRSNLEETVQINCTSNDFLID